MRTEITKKSFDGQHFYIGIDVHKKSWKVTIMSEHYEHKSFSQDPDAAILSNYMHKYFPGGIYHAVYEAGFCGFNICRQLNCLGIDCIVIHPADVPTTRKEKLQKTDKADSRKLAKTLRAQSLSAIDIPSRELEADRALVRQRYRITKDLSRVKNRVKSLLYQFEIIIPTRFTQAQTRYWSRPYLDWLKSLELEEPSLKLVIHNYISEGEKLRQEVLLLNKQIRQLSKEERYKKKYELMISIPGIGFLTTMFILTQLGDISRFKRLDDLCNYVGLVPRMWGSGEKMQTGKMIKRGRKDIKIMLIEASWIAIRHDPALMHKFNELSVKLHKNKAIVRIARKMLSRIRYVLINEQPYCIGVC